MNRKCFCSDKAFSWLNDNLQIKPYLQLKEDGWNIASVGEPVYASGKNDDHSTHNTIINKNNFLLTAKTVRDQKVIIRFTHPVCDLLFKQVEKQFKGKFVNIGDQTYALIMKNIYLWRDSTAQEFEASKCQENYRKLDQEHEHIPGDTNYYFTLKNENLNADNFEIKKQFPEILTVK